MNKYILLLFALSLSMIVGSCKKKKPPVGIYVGTFSYNYPNWPDKIIWYKITDTNEDYFLIDMCDYQGNLLSAYQDTVYKDKKKEVHGRVPSYGPWPYEIKGKWSHKLFKEYTIEGDFTQRDYTHGGVFTYSGTFVIKSKNDCN